MDCPDWSGDGSEDAVAVGGTGLEIRDKVTRGSVDVYKAPVLERVADLTEKYSDLATVAVGAKTPALDMADLFAAMRGRQLVAESTGIMQRLCEDSASRRIGRQTRCDGGKQARTRCRVDVAARQDFVE